MSRLLDHLKIIDTQERKYLPKPLKMVDAKFHVEDWYLQEQATVYRVEARLGAQVVVSDATKVSGNFYETIKAGVYRPLAEEVFGEFRQPLLDAEFAILQGEYEKASKLINSVLDSMFKV